MVGNFCPIDNDNADDIFCFAIDFFLIVCFCELKRNNLLYGMLINSFIQYKLQVTPEPELFIIESQNQGCQFCITKAPQ